MFRGQIPLAHASPLCVLFFFWQTSFELPCGIYVYNQSYPRKTGYLSNNCIVSLFGVPDKQVSASTTYPIRDNFILPTINYSHHFLYHRLEILLLNFWPSVQSWPIFWKGKYIIYKKWLEHKLSKIDQWCWLSLNCRNLCLPTFFICTLHSPELNFKWKYHGNNRELMMWNCT